jgi:hypothetical protein
MMNIMIDNSWWIDWMTDRRDAFTWLQSDRQLWPPPGLSMVMQSLTVIGPLHQVIGSSGFGRQMVGCVQCAAKIDDGGKFYPGCYLALGPGMGKSGIWRNMAVAAPRLRLAATHPPPHHLSSLPPPPPPFLPPPPLRTTQPLEIYCRLHLFQIFFDKKKVEYCVRIYIPNVYVWSFCWSRFFITIFALADHIRNFQFWFNVFEYAMCIIV